MRPITRWAWAAMVFLGGCCGSIGQGGLPSSSGTVVLAPEMIADALNASVADEVVATEVAVLGSETIARDALRHAGMTEPFGGDEESALVGLLGATRVERVDDSLVIRVSVSSPDPEAAAEACNGILRAYLDFRMLNRRAAIQQQQQWLGDQLAELDLERESTTDPSRRAELDVQYTLLHERMTEAELDAALNPSDVQILDRCTVPIP